MRLLWLDDNFFRFVTLLLMRYGVVSRETGVVCRMSLCNFPDTRNRQSINEKKH